MYTEKLAIAVKTNGKVLREEGDIVRLPFGSEYSLLIKNLNTVRAVVNITIDGIEVVEGGLAVEGGQSIDLERFVKNGNWNAGNRFKFIERTAKVEQGPRGIGIEDGLIRVEFQFAKQRYDYIPPPYNSPWKDVPLTSTSNRDFLNIHTTFNGISGTVFASAATKLSAKKSFGDVSDTYADISVSYTAPKNDVGITVPGSISEQKFQMVADIPMEPAKHVMILKIVGEIAGVPVKAPVTVKTKQKCVTCGHLNKSNAKFCIECGTGLVFS